MRRHLLIYDVDWWILGKNAKILQRYHPCLDIMSAEQLDRYIGAHGSGELNDTYEVISSMCLGLAAYAIFKHVRVDSSAAVSYYYFSKDYHAFREWEDRIEPDISFLQLVLSRIGTIGAINRKLAETIQELVPAVPVQYIRQFVDDGLFKPNHSNRSGQDEFVIGWAGDKGKASKNYDRLYLPVKRHYENHPRIRFAETCGERSHETMPGFYHNIDLLFMTSANEGGGATALEAYACGIPVLSTNVGYVKEAAPPEARHLILDSDDPARFIRMIDEISTQKEMLTEIGRKCRANIEAFWTVNHAVKSWLSVLFRI